MQDPFDLALAYLTGIETKTKKTQDQRTQQQRMMIRMAKVQFCIGTRKMMVRKTPVSFSKTEIRWIVVIVRYNEYIAIAYCLLLIYHKPASSFSKGVWRQTRLRAKIGIFVFWRLYFRNSLFIRMKRPNCAYFRNNAFVSCSMTSRIIQFNELLSSWLYLRLVCDNVHYILVSTPSSLLVTKCFDGMEYFLGICAHYWGLHDQR